MLDVLAIATRPTRNHLREYARVLQLAGTHRITALKGNHEQMMLEARDSPEAAADWLLDLSELPDLLDYDIIACDATYLYYRGTPLYPFGHGLSYTTFAYRNLRLSATSISPNDTLVATVEVSNTGDRVGDEVVQLYIRDLVGSITRPVKELKGFHKVELAPGERTTQTFRKAGTFKYRCTVTGHSSVSDGRCVGMCGKVRAH